MENLLLCQAAPSKWRAEGSWGTVAVALPASVQLPPLAMPRTPATAGPARRCPGLAALTVLFVFLGCRKAAKCANKN